MTAGFSSGLALAGAGKVISRALAPFDRHRSIRYPLKNATTPGDVDWSLALPAGLADVYPLASTGATFPAACWLQTYVWAVNRHAKDIVTVYVPGDWAGAFADRVLPRLTKRIVLVTGDSDRTSLTETLGDDCSPAAFLDDDRIVAVFAQNLETVDHRTFPIPIGVDLHTIHHYAEGRWGMPGGQTPASQEADLVRIRNDAPDFTRRDLAIHAMFSLGTNRGARILCLAALNQVPIARIEETGIARETVWTRMAACQFVASPHGGGYDSHRTWEALALGCVPIVKRVPAMSPMFDRLPVWEVDNFDEVTEDTARKKAREVGDRLAAADYDLEKLEISWWRKHLDDEAGRLTGAIFQPQQRAMVSP